MYAKVRVGYVCFKRSLKMHKEDNIGIPRLDHFTQRFDTIVYMQYEASFRLWRAALR